MDDTYAIQKKERLLNPEVEKVVEIGIERLRPFVNHPFKVKDDEDMEKLLESVMLYGIMNQRRIKS